MRVAPGRHLAASDNGEGGGSSPRLITNVLTEADMLLSHILELLVRPRFLLEAG